MLTLPAVSLSVILHKSPSADLGVLCPSEVNPFFRGYDLLVQDAECGVKIVMRIVTVGGTFQVTSR